jgi:hypothetical protein
MTKLRFSDGLIMYVAATLAVAAAQEPAWNAAAIKDPGSIRSKRRRS